MDFNNEKNIIIEGMTSISSLINAIQSGINDRKIISVYVSKTAVIKKIVK